MTIEELFKVINEVCESHCDCKGCEFRYANAQCLINGEDISKHAKEIVQVCEAWKKKQEEPEVEWVFAVGLVGGNTFKIFETEDEAMTCCERYAKAYPDNKYSYKQVCRVKE